MNNKEQQVMNDLNHKLSNEIVKIANNNNADIVFQKLNPRKVKLNQKI